MSSRQKPTPPKSRPGPAAPQAVAPPEPTVPDEETLQPLIVGIGASAGGLEAYKAFFEKMPADNDIAFVLVQHLAPNHTSMLVDLIGRHTQMPVVEATDGAQVEARHVYIIPPDATLTITDGVLQLSKPAPPRQY